VEVVSSWQELVGTVAAVANVEAHLAQEALAEEKNDANAAVFLLLKRQEEAELVAVQEGKAGQGAAQPRNTSSSAGAVGRAGKPHTAGQLQRRRQQQQQQQQSGKEHNHPQAHEMQRPRASGNPPMAKPKGNPKGKGTGRGT
jgi:transcription initiation factor TFIID subunit TAF12